MTANISYMGTKRELAGAVAEVISAAQPGMLLDAFAGMGAVAQAVGTTRNVWMNDAQRFAQIVGRCMFTARERPKPGAVFAQITKDFYRHNLDSLRRKNRSVFLSCANAITATSFSEMSQALDQSADAEIARSDYSCFLQSYRAGFFSDIQAAEIDSIRFAIDHAKGLKRLSYDQWRWALVALGRAALKVANTPGHFAQFLTPSEKNYKRVQKQWQRSVWDEWIDGLNIISPIGTTRWRAGNISTNEDSLELLSSDDANRLGVVYCDPPYTDDQYSRYYHVWETLVEYDYPTLTGAGRYRPGRFTTPFSIKSKAVAAMTDLVEKVSATGADLVLSYPTNGLIYESGADPLNILRDHFLHVEIMIEVTHNHSTFGASKGNAKSAVQERVYLAQN